MGDIGRVLNTTKEALLSHLTALNVTGSNVANVDTPGYSRLRPVFGSIGVIGSSTNDVQVGVKITAIERLYDKYLEVQLVQQEQDTGNNQARMDLLNNVEGIFNESTGGGINDLLSQFWGAWSQLSSNPSGTAERDNLVSISQSLASMFSQKANDLINIQSDTNSAISDSVTELNKYLDEMVDLNNKVVQTEISGGSAASSRDQRAELLQKISQIIDVNYYEESNGSLNIFISNGKSLVEGTNVWKLDVKTNPANSNYYDIVFEDTPDESINERLTSGKLAGMLDVRDTKIAGYLNDLDQMASTIVTNINAQHRSGYDLNNNIGGDFFSPARIEAPVAASGNTYAGTTSSSGTYTGTTNKTYTVKIVAGGALGTATYKVSSDDGTTWGAVQTIPVGGTITAGDGVNLTFPPDTFATNDVFSVKAGCFAKDMQVNSTIVNDSGKIAASATVNNGDGDNAGSINAIKDSLLMGGGISSIDNFYQSLVASVGNDVADAKRILDHQTAVMNQLESQKEAVSGVSVDEEMLNLIKYQAGYNAAARMCGVVNQMMDVLINLGKE